MICSVRNLLQSWSETGEVGSLPQADMHHCAIAGEGLIESNRRAPDAFFLFFELPASRYREIYYGQGRK